MPTRPLHCLDATGKILRLLLIIQMYLIGSSAAAQSKGGFIRRRSTHRAADWNNIGVVAKPERELQSSSSSSDSMISIGISNIGKGKGKGGKSGKQSSPSSGKSKKASGSSGKNSKATSKNGSSPNGSKSMKSRPMVNSSPSSESKTGKSRSSSVDCSNIFDKYKDGWGYYSGDECDDIPHPPPVSRPTSNGGLSKSGGGSRPPISFTNRPTPSDFSPTPITRVPTRPPSTITLSPNQPSTAPPVTSSPNNQPNTVAPNMQPTAQQTNAPTMQPVLMPSPPTSAPVITMSPIFAPTTGITSQPTPVQPPSSQTGSPNQVPTSEPGTRCEVGPDGGFGTLSGASLTTDFAYETTVTPAVLANDLNDDILERVENLMAVFVLEQLFERCRGGIAVAVKFLDMTDRGGGRHLQTNALQGWSTRPPDTVINGVECSRQSTFPCFVIRGRVTSYVDGLIDTGLDGQVRAAVRTAIEDGDLQSVDNRLLEVTYRDTDLFPVPSSDDESDAPALSPTADPVDVPTSAPASPATRSTDDDRLLENWMIALIAAGAAFFLCLLYICIRRPSHRALSPSDEDDDSSDSDDSDDESNGKPQNEFIPPSMPIYRPPITKEASDRGSTSGGGIQVSTVDSRGSGDNNDTNEADNDATNTNTIPAMAPTSNNSFENAFSGMPPMNDGFQDEPNERGSFRSGSSSGSSSGSPSRSGSGSRSRTSGSGSSSGSESRSSSGRDSRSGSRSRSGSGRKSEASSESATLEDERENSFAESGTGSGAGSGTDPSDHPSVDASISLRDDQVSLNLLEGQREEPSQLSFSAFDPNDPLRESLVGNPESSDSKGRESSYSEETASSGSSDDYEDEEEEYEIEYVEDEEAPENEETEEIFWDEHDEELNDQDEQSNDVPTLPWLGSGQSSGGGSF